MGVCGRSEQSDVIEGSGNRGDKIESRLGQSDGIESSRKSDDQSDGQSNEICGSVEG